MKFLCQVIIEIHTAVRDVNTKLSRSAKKVQLHHTQRLPRFHQAFCGVAARKDGGAAGAAVAGEIFFSSGCFNFQGVF